VIAILRLEHAEVSKQLTGGPEVERKNHTYKEVEMNPASRQDVQNIVEVARNRTLERMPAKQDFLQLFDNVRNLINLHQQSQQLLKQSEYQRSQLSRRVVALEARITALDNELKTTQFMIARLAERPAQQIAMPERQEQQTSAAPSTEYVYRPA
jgi:hypothetical protein